MKKVSELLREERIKKGYTLSDIQQATKIKTAFLKAIEDGRFHALPSESYALGFVKSYAAYLGLPLSKMAAYFRREYEGDREEFMPSFRKSPEQFKKNSIFTPTRAVIVFIILVVTGYIVYQYNSLLFKPELTIEQPKDNQVFSKNIIRVQGKTDPYATVAVDGDETLVGIDGKFSKSLYVFSGDKKITILAKNRFGKENRREINVKVR